MDYDKVEQLLRLEERLRLHTNLPSLLAMVTRELAELNEAAAVKEYAAKKKDAEEAAAGKKEAA